MQTNKPTSLELSLTERYQERLDHHTLGRHAAKLALKRIAMIYSGQLHFEWPEPPAPPPQRQDDYLTSSYEF